VFSDQDQVILCRFFLNNIELYWPQLQEHIHFQQRSYSGFFLTSDPKSPALLGKSPFPCSHHQILIHAFSPQNQL